MYFLPLESFAPPIMFYTEVSKKKLEKDIEKRISVWEVNLDTSYFANIVYKQDPKFA